MYTESFAGDIEAILEREAKASNPAAKIVKLANGTDITGRYFDVCPVHGTEEKKDYEFGWRDAIVTTFDGCKCAICKEAHWPDTWYFNGYRAAAAKATMIKKEYAAW